jgi:hypothetical protein
MLWEVYFKSFVVSASSNDEAKAKVEKMLKRNNAMPAIEDVIPYGDDFVQEESAEIVEFNDIK